MAEALPTARFTVVEGASHFLFHEQPAAARDAVSSWLETAT
jgi:pimeloyl-ACP methyl ester carboxylesterase